MNFEKLFTKLKTFAHDGWVKCYLEVKYEDGMQNYTAFSIVEGKEIMFSPVEFSLDCTEMTEIKKFKDDWKNNSKEKWNTIILNIYPDSSIDFITKWNQEFHDQAELFSELMNEKLDSTLGRVVSQSTESITQLGQTRYQKVQNILLQETVVYGLNLKEENIISEFFCRLYSLLGEPTEIVCYSGFYYSIKEVSSNELFYACLSQSQVGYFAEKNNGRVKKVIKDFHDLLFSNELEIKDCSIEIENDFGILKLEAFDGVIVEEQKK